MKKIILLFAFMLVANISDSQSVIQRNKTKDRVEKSNSTQSRTNPAPRMSNATKISKPASGYENGHEWVDLGLSVKWATCNVGANNPSDYGGYYAWGETTTKASYTYDNCFDCLDSEGKNWGIYKNGGKTRITPTSGHDTARENWGGTWRMPTGTEFDELCRKCRWSWTSSNGHKGCIVTGPNGNSIFLPATGYRYSTNLANVDEIGDYWSSTLSSSGVARNMAFNGDGQGTYEWFSRYAGLSVRPVTE